MSARATAAVGFPWLSHRTVAEVWGLPASQPIARKIDLSRAVSMMERRAEGWRL